MLPPLVATVRPGCHSRKLGAAFSKKESECTTLITSAKDKVLTRVNSLTPSFAGSHEDPLKVKASFFR
jgi:hypothetical protein